MPRFVLSIPWDTSKNRIVTTVLPLSGMAMSLSFLILLATMALRTFPTLHLQFWVFPVGAAVLFISTHIGIIQYYLQLPPSIRVIEFLLLAVVVAFTAIRSSVHYIDLMVNIGIPLGAWVLSLNMSIILSGIWPEMKVPHGLEETGLLQIAEKANRSHSLTWDENLATFTTSYRELITKLGKGFLGTLLALSLIRPDTPESMALKIVSGSAMALFCLSAYAGWSCTNLLGIRNVEKAKGIRVQEGFEAKVLVGFSRLLAPLALISVLLPAGLAPTASSDFGGLGSKINYFMSRITDVIGRAMYVSVPPPQDRQVGGFTAKLQGWFVMFFKFADSLIRNPLTQGQWDSARVTMSILTIMFVAAFAVIILYGLVISIVRLANRFRDAEIPVPEIPWGFILSLILWPLGIYRVLRWLVLKLADAVASLMAGGIEGKGERRHPGLGDLAKLFGMHLQSAMDIPRDPRAFIRFIFSRMVSLAKRYGSGSPRNMTPGEYALALGERFPGVKENLDDIKVAYERVRYGAKPADPEAAHRVNAAFGSVRTGIRQATPTHGSGQEELREMEYQGPDEGLGE